MNAPTETCFYLPATGGLGLILMGTMLLVGCGESATPEAEQNTPVAEKSAQPPQAEASQQEEQSSAADTAPAEVAIDHPEQQQAEANDLTLPDLASPRLNSPMSKAENSAPILRAPLKAPATDLEESHPPFKSQGTQLKTLHNSEDTAEEQKPAERSSQAATVAEAERVIDLRKLSQPTGTQAIQISPTQLSLTAPASVQEMKRFYQQALTAAGWELNEPESAAPMSAEYDQLEFTKEGFQLGVTLSRYAGSQETNVSINNFGNLDARQLPRPAESQELFGNAMSMLYVTAEDVSTAAQSCLQQLTEAGWQAYQQPYTMTTEEKSQRRMTLMQNGVGLTVFVTVAPAQRNQTTVQYALQMLGDQLPAPADAQAIEFLESPLQLSCDTPHSIEETLTYYRDSLSALGWKESSGAHQQPTEAVAVFQRVEGLPIVLRLNRTDDGGRTHVAIAEFEMPSDAPAPVSHQAPALSPVAESPVAETYNSERQLAESALDDDLFGEKPLTKTQEESRLVEVPPGKAPILPGVLPGLMTFEDWLEKHNYQPSPERLNQFAKEMEEIANRSPELLTTDKPKALAALSEHAQTNALGQMITLDLQGKKLEPSEWKQIAGQHQLSEISLAGSNITDQDLKLLLGLSKLSSLNLSETAITDAGIPQLIQLRALRVLNLSGTKISPAGRETLRAALPECDIQ